MHPISITELDKNNNLWVYSVVVGEDKQATTHTVTLTKEYCDKLTNSKIGPEELVKKSFEFLLEREPRESILKEFDLPVIERYFPEYASSIM